MHDARGGPHVNLNNTGGPVDIWAVDGVNHGDLVDAGSGYLYLPSIIGPHRVHLY